MDERLVAKAVLRVSRHDQEKIKNHIGSQTDQGDLQVSRCLEGVEGRTTVRTPAMPEPRA